jgi:sarcosine oxidase
VFRHVHGTVERTALAARARRGWTAWEERFGCRLIGDEGTLVTGETVEAVADVLRAAGVPFSTGRGPLSEAMPVAARVELPWLLDETAGAVRPERAVGRLLTALGDRCRGAIVFGVAVDDGVTVETSEGPWRGDHVVVCAGAQTAPLAAAHGIRIPEERGLHPQAYFPVRGGLDGRRLPCLLERSGRFGATCYASAVGTTGLYSVGLSSVGNTIPVDPGTSIAAGGGDLDEQRARTVAYVEQALPGLEPVPERFRACVVTSLAGDEDGWDVWQRGGATFFAGHNTMKFAPLLGEQLAQAALAGEAPAELHNRL